MNMYMNALHFIYTNQLNFRNFFGHSNLIINSYMSLIIWGCLAAAAFVGPFPVYFNHDYGIGDTVSDVATELILDITKVLSIIKLCI